MRKIVFSLSAVLTVCKVAATAKTKSKRNAVIVLCWNNLFRIIISGLLYQGILDISVKIGILLTSDPSLKLILFLPVWFEATWIKSTFGS